MRSTQSNKTKEGHQKENSLITAPGPTQNTDSNGELVILGSSQKVWVEEPPTMVTPAAITQASEDASLEEFPPTKISVDDDYFLIEIEILPSGQHVRHMQAEDWLTDEQLDAVREHIKQYARRQSLSPLEKIFTRHPGES